MISIGDKNLNDLDLPNHIDFTLNEIIEEDDLTKVKDRIKYLYEAIIADEWNKKIKKDYVDFCNPKKLSPNLKNINNIDYRKKLLKILDKYNITYSFDKNDNIAAKAFKEYFYEFHNCLIHYVYEDAFYNPLNLQAIMEDEKSLFNFLFNDER